MNHHSTADVERLIALESQYDLWSAEIRGVRLWSQARYAVLSRIITQWLRYNYPVSTRYRRLTFRDLRRYARGMTLFSPFRRAHDALFFVTDLGRLPLDTRHSFDRVHDVYFRLFHNPLIIESNYTPDPSLPDAHFENNHYPHTILSALVRFPTSSLSAPEQRTVDEFVNYVTEIYQIPALTPVLRASITTAVSRVNNWRRIIARTLTPRIALSPHKKRVAWIENACYLEQSGLLTSLLHEYGFIVFEAQHGLLSPFHAAYHVPIDVIDNAEHPARVYYPDVFLTFGDYWSQQARIPSEKFTIGSPQISRMLNRLDSAKTTKHKQVLVISGDTRAVNLAKVLAQALPDHRFIFKLHPLEFARQDEMTALLNYPNMRVLGKTDIYSLIAESEIIIGHNSTALVEAAAFANKRIFFYEPAFIPAEVGTRFEDAETLVRLILDSSTGHPSAQPNDFWELHIQERLEAFGRTYLR